jgi:hypothetical protein
MKFSEFAAAHRSSLNDGTRGHRPSQLAHRPVFDDVEVEAQGEALPIVIRPRRPISLAQWLDGACEDVDFLLEQSGALLFRGFGVMGAKDFESCLRGYARELMTAHEDTSPRTAVRGDISTSTDYPAAESIVFHNESSYSRRVPLRIYLHCVLPAESGGETPLAHCGHILRHIDPAIVRRFEEQGWLYVRNYVAGLGLDWRRVYRCEDRATLERTLRDGDIRWEWARDGHLRTISRRPAIMQHPRTLERLWFNHILFWHVTSLPPSIRHQLQAEFSPEDLPVNTYYGDGSPIEANVLEEIRSAYARVESRFAWESGDLLFVDNVKCAHGRASYSGQRRVLFAMGDCFDRRGSRGWTAEE